MKDIFGLNKEIQFLFIRSLSYRKIFILPNSFKAIVAKITITGKVHGVGYRAFLLEEADSLLIPNFEARNVKINGKEALIVLIDGEIIAYC
jgi:hypothetical protein